MSQRRDAEPRTEGRRVADALKRSEQAFQNLVASVEDYAIFLLDGQGHVKSWNAGAQRIKGYAPGEILGEHFSIFYPTEEVERGWPQQELETAAREGRFENEGWRLRKDGSRFWANVVITAERAEDGTLQGFLKITRDLSERKQAEETLRQSEERLRLMIEGVRDYAIFALTPDGRIASWNAGAERIKGYKAEEVLGKHFSLFYSPEALAQGKPETLLRAAVEHGSVEDEDWRVRKDGRRFWANAVITALFDAAGDLRGFAKVTRDMTDRRQVDRLQEADRLKDEFLALLAHELRNPLAPIRSAIHILGSPVAADDELARARAIAERQIQHMSRLLDDLLDVARVSQGKLGLRREVIDVSRIVHRAVEAEQPFIQTQGLELTVDVPAVGLGVDADPTRLQQVLTNLLNNAAKYTESGGRIWLTAESEGDHVVFRVRDSGIGIDPPTIPRLFQLFEQGERRMERSAGGVGVGLALVKRLVEMHGGSVHAFSAGLGRGSEFTVRLPRVEIAPRATGPHATLASRPAGKCSLRVLVVDDNVDAADGLKMLMELNGEQVRAAYDGESALTIARDFRPEVALLDVGMPRMDGYEIARRLKTAPETRETVLVAVTGWGQPEDRKRSREAGFDHHLVKPVEPSALEKLLDSFKPKRAL
jgi:PAS domain S-box-containing protein